MLYRLGIGRESVHTSQTVDSNSAKLLPSLLYGRKPGSDRGGSYAHKLIFAADLVRSIPSIQSLQPKKLQQPNSPQKTSPLSSSDLLTLHLQISAPDSLVGVGGPISAIEVCPELQIIFTLQNGHLSARSFDILERVYNFLGPLKKGIEV